MGHQFEPLLGDQLSGCTADAIRLVLNPHESRLKRIDELKLPLGQLSRLFFRQGRGTFFQNLECGRCVLSIIAGAVSNRRPELLIIISCLFELFQNEFFEFLL